MALSHLSTHDCLCTARETLNFASRSIDEAEASMQATHTIIAECQLLIAAHHSRTEERRKELGAYRSSWF